MQDIFVSLVVKSKKEGNKTVQIINRFRHKKHNVKITTFTYDDFLRSSFDEASHIVAPDSDTLIKVINNLPTSLDSKVFNLYSFLVYLDTGVYLKPVKLSSEQYKVLHSKLLEMISFVHDVCEENKLNYVLHGGTLLGAVRHKGFIPWDDDVDIIMPRSDYNKLIEILKKQNTTPFIASTFQNSKNYFKYLNKLSLSVPDTIIADRYPCNNSKYLQSLSIDILPVDFVARPGGLIQKFKKHATILLHKIYKARIDKYHSAIYGNFYQLLSIFFSRQLLFQLNELITQFSNRKQQEYVHFFSAFSNFETLYSKTFKFVDIKNRMLTKFEDKQFYITKNYYEWLTQMFGQRFMEIPKRRNKYNHIAYKIVLK